MQILATIEYDRRQQIGIGQGQNSAVYLSHDPQLGGECAVKVIEKARLAYGANFWAESQAMHASRHEHVVPVNCASQTADHICLAMPYYRRGSLADRIAAGPIPPMEVVRVGQGILC